MSQRQLEIQTTSEMTPYFTRTKCNKISIISLLAQLNDMRTVSSSISAIAMNAMRTGNI